MLNPQDCTSWRAPYVTSVKVPTTTSSAFRPGKCGWKCAAGKLYRIKTNSLMPPNISVHQCTSCQVSGNKAEQCKPILAGPIWASCMGQRICCFEALMQILRNTGCLWKACPKHSQQKAQGSDKLVNPQTSLKLQLFAEACWAASKIYLSPLRPARPSCQQAPLLESNGVSGTAKIQRSHKRKASPSSTLMWAECRLFTLKMSTKSSKLRPSWWACPNRFAGFVLVPPSRTT